MNWRNRIIELLTGEAFEIPEPRLDWTGFSSVYSIYLNASSRDKVNILMAMRFIIEDNINSQDEGRWKLIANIIHLSTFMGNTSEILGKVIFELDPKAAPTDQLRGIIAYAKDSYKASNPPSHSLRELEDENNKDDTYVPLDRTKRVIRPSEQEFGGSDKE